MGEGIRFLHTLSLDRDWMGVSMGLAFYDC